MVYFAISAGPFMGAGLAPSAFSAAGMAAGTATLMPQPSTTCFVSDGSDGMLGGGGAGASGGASDTLASESDGARGALARLVKGYGDFDEGLRRAGEKVAEVAIAGVQFEARQKELAGQMAFLGGQVGAFHSLLASVGAQLASLRDSGDRMNSDLAALTAAIERDAEVMEEQTGRRRETEAILEGALTVFEELLGMFAELQRGPLSDWPPLRKAFTAMSVGAGQLRALRGIPEPVLQAEEMPPEVPPPAAPEPEPLAAAPVQPVEVAPGPVIAPAEMAPPVEAEITEVMPASDLPPLVEEIPSAPVTAQAEPAPAVHEVPLAVEEQWPGDLGLEPAPPAEPPARIRSESDLGYELDDMFSLPQGTFGARAGNWRADMLEVWSRMESRKLSRNPHPAWLVASGPARTGVVYDSLCNLHSLLQDRDAELLKDALAKAITDDRSFRSLMGLVYDVAKGVMTRDGFFDLLRHRRDVLERHGEQRASQLDLFSILWGIYIEDRRIFMGACAELNFAEAMMSDGKTPMSVERMPFERFSCDFLVDNEYYEVKFIPPYFSVGDIIARLHAAKRQLDSTSVRLSWPGATRHIVLYRDVSGGEEVLGRINVAVRSFERMVRGVRARYDVRICDLEVMEISEGGHDAEFSADDSELEALVQRSFAMLGVEDFFPSITPKAKDVLTETVVRINGQRKRLAAMPLPKRMADESAFIDGLITPFTSFEIPSDEGGTVEMLERFATWQEHSLDIFRHVESVRQYEPARLLTLALGLLGGGARSRATTTVTRTETAIREMGPINLEDIAIRRGYYGQGLEAIEEANSEYVSGRSIAAKDYVRTATGMKDAEGADLAGYAEMFIEDQLRPIEAMLAERGDDLSEVGFIQSVMEGLSAVKMMCGQSADYVSMDAKVVIAANIGALRSSLTALAALLQSMDEEAGLAGEKEKFLKRLIDFSSMTAIDDAVARARERVERVIVEGETGNLKRHKTRAERVLRGELGVRNFSKHDGSVTVYEVKSYIARLLIDEIPQTQRYQDVRAGLTRLLPRNNLAGSTGLCELRDLLAEYYSLTEQEDAAA